MLEVYQSQLVVLCLNVPLQSANLLLPHVDFVLVGADLDLLLFVHLLLTQHELVHLLAHVFDLHCLRVVDVGLPVDLLVALLDFVLLLFVGLAELLVVVSGSGQLDLNVADGVLQFSVLHLCQPQHLPCFFLSALHAVDPEPFAGLVSVCDLGLEWSYL